MGTLPTTQLLEFQGLYGTIETFIEGIWMPESQDLSVAVYDGDGALVRTSTVSYREPDAVLERQYLPTLVVEDGVQQQQQRATTVEVLKTEPGAGAIYELRIPVTDEEAFPFVFNVQQKTPVTERRNELDNSYRSSLMRGIINERLDLFDDAELGEEYVIQHISQYAHKTSSNTQQEYIERRFGTTPDDLLVYTGETPSTALTWAMQRQVPMENADEYSRNAGGILTKQCPSVQEWFDDQTDGRSIEVIDDPEPEQEAFLNYIEDELVPRTRASGVDFTLAYISEDTDDGQTHASYSPASEPIYLNALADNWDEPTPKRIGTILHELGHHETDPEEDGHGPQWYHAIEELSGDVIHQLQEEHD